MGSGTIRGHIRAQVLYMIVALMNCMCRPVLRLGPMRLTTCYADALLYLFTVDCCYALSTAAVLEFPGDSGMSGGTRRSSINSLENISVLYVLQVNGWGGKRWGDRGLAGAEALVGAFGALPLLACCCGPSAPCRPAAAYAAHRSWCRGARRSRSSDPCRPISATGVHRNARPS